MKLGPWWKKTPLWARNWSSLSCCSSQKPGSSAAPFCVDYKSQHQDHCWVCKISKPRHIYWMHSAKLALTLSFFQHFSSHLQIITLVSTVTWTVTSNQKKAFLFVWTQMSEEPILLQWNQWNKHRVRCKCATSRVLAQLFSSVLQPWIPHFHFTSFWFQIQPNVTIYLSHRHMCRQIATTDSHVRYPRRTTNR